MEYYSAIKKNEILPFAMTWMDLESIMLSEISQSEKDKYSDFTHMWNLGNKTNEQRGKRERKRQIKQQTRNYGEQTDGYHRESGEEDG